MRESKQPIDEIPPKMQAIIRGYLARKKFSIPRALEKTGFPLLLVGNDPCLTMIELDKFKTTGDRVTILGVGGMRSIAIACALSSPVLPAKLILMDNSHFVISFWRKLRKLAEISSNEIEFKKEFTLLVKKCSHVENYNNLKIHINPFINKRYPVQNPFHFIENLFNEYSFSLVQKIIKGTTIILQDWENSKAFNAINNVCNYLNLKNRVVYSSNVLSCVALDSFKESDSALIISSNITLFKPNLIIQTDLCEMHGVPEKVYLIMDPRHQFIQKPSYFQNFLKHMLIGVCLIILLIDIAPNLSYLFPLLLALNFALHIFPPTEVVTLPNEKENYPRASFFKEKPIDVLSPRKIFAHCSL